MMRIRSCARSYYSRKMVLAKENSRLMISTPWPRGGGKPVGQKMSQHLKTLARARTTQQRTSFSGTVSRTILHLLRGAARTIMYSNRLGLW